MAESKKIVASDVVEKDVFKNTIESAELLTKSLDDVKLGLESILTEQQKILTQSQKGGFGDPKQINEVNNAINNSVNTREALESVNARLIEVSARLKKAEDELNKKKTESNSTDKQRLSLLEKINKAQSQEGLEIARLKKQLSDLNKENQKTISGLKTAEGAYAKLNKEFQENFKRSQDLLASNKALTASEQDFINKTLALDARLKTIDKTLGNSKRFVGEYERGFNGLSNSINQVTREFPSFAFSAQTGFLALSNNIPILVDEISKLSAANKALVEQGKPVKGVFTQIVSSLFSFQTLLSVGVSLLVVYGKEIGELVSGFFELKKAIDPAKEALNEYNRIVAEGVNNSIDETVRTEQLIRQSKNLNLTYEERKSAISELQKKYPAIFANYKDEADINKNIFEIGKKISDNLVERAKNEAKLKGLQATRAAIVGLSAKEKVLKEQIAEIDEKVPETLRKQLAVQTELGRRLKVGELGKQAELVQIRLNNEKELVDIGNDLKKQRILEAKLKKEIGDITKEELETLGKITKELKEQGGATTDLVEVRERELKLLQSIEGVTLDLLRIRREGAQTESDYDTILKQVNKQFQIQRDLLKANEIIERGNVKTADEKRVISEKYAREIEKINKDEKDTVSVLKQGETSLGIQVKLLRDIGTEQDIISQKALDRATLEAEQKELIEDNLELTKSAEEERLRIFDTKQDQFNTELKLLEDRFKTEQGIFFKRLKTVDDIADKEAEIAGNQFDEKTRLLELEFKKKEEIEGKTLALEAEKRRKEEALEREFNDKLNKIREERSEETKRIIKEEVQAQVSALNQTLSAVSQVSAQRTQVELDRGENELRIRSENQDRQADLAAQGLQNTLAFEQQARAQQELDNRTLREKEARRQEAIKLAQVYLDAYSAELNRPNSNPATAGAKALAATLVAKGVAKTIASLDSKFEGTEDIGTVRNPLDSNGGRLIIAHDNERIMTKKQNSLVGDISNDELATLGYWYRTGKISPFDSNPEFVIKQNKGFDTNVLLSNKIDTLIKEVKNKPVQQVNVDELGNLIETMYKGGMKTVVKHKNAIRI